MEGWQTRLYMDAFGAVPGTTQIPGLLRNWQVQMQNNLARVYTADNVLAANRVVSGMLDVTSKLTFDANPAQALTEFSNWDAATKRIIRLEFVGPNAEIEAAVNDVQTGTISGSPSSGAMPLNVLGVTTAGVAFDATGAQAASAIQTALQAAFGSTYTVGGTGSAGGPWVITFSGPGVAGRTIPIITNGTSTFDAGTVGWVHTTAGYSGGRSVTVDIPGAWTAVNLGGNADQIRTYELDLQSVYDPTTLAAMIAITCQNNRATAF
jgi:hypothetical protein